MTDKELIKQEIERRIKNLEFSLENNCVEKHSKLGILGNITTLESLFQFINSLPEEPVSEDLDKEIGKYTTNELLKKRNHSTGIYHLTQKDCDNIARHFAEWQHGKDFDDLLQSEMKFPKEYYDRGKADAMKEMKEALQTEYEKGRFDMREEMMKDAVEDCSVIFLSDNKNWLQIPGANLVKALESFKQGDKVKIIIVKED